MIAIQIPVNIYYLGAALLAAALLGFILRSKQIKKLKRKIGELEKEVLSTHADILEFQKEKTVLEQKLKENSSSPVIPITAVSADETKPDKDMALRKKLISQQSAEKH